MKRLGLYLHIPFCKSKCLYCDFCSLPHVSPARMEAYADRLCRDLIAHAPSCEAYTVDTVYFGGGTPTCMPAETLCRILHTVFAQYRVAKGAEICLECNPGTVTPQDLLTLRQGGFDRISIGLQSAHAEELRALGRLHDFNRFADTLRAARQAGFANISADVMLGIPHQTAASLSETLKRLCALEPDHVSAYALTVEEGTPFGKRGASALDLPDEETVREMYLGTVDLLRNFGLEQYEISNFARQGYESRHNLKYWTLGEYLGLGPAAYSDFAGERFGNSRDIEGYLHGEVITAERERLSTQARQSERIMLGLRLTRGLSAAALGADAVVFLERLIPHGLVRKDGGRYALTPSGFLISNAILSELVDFSQDGLVK